LKLASKVIRYLLIAGSLLYLAYAINQIDLSTWPTGILNGRSGVLLLLTLVLTIVNYGIETRKWIVLLQPSISLPFSKAYRSVLAGTSATTFLPARSGEYLGRMLFLPDTLKLPSIAAGIIGGLGQLGATLILGLLSWNLLLNQPDVPFKSWLGTPSFLLVLSCGMIFILFFPKISASKRFRRWSWMSIASSYTPSTLARVLLLSLLRYGVFSIQFYLLIIGFTNIDPSFQLFLQLMAIFFLQTVVPVPATVDLGVRMYATSLFFSAPTIIIPVSLLWILNVILPALVGTIILAVSNRNRS
jgi:uncharacterized membrane protein YbhN (UPF0104 family)